MSKLKFNKINIRIAIYTIVMLIAISLASYPKTNALLKKDEDNALTYIAYVKDVYKKDIIKIPSKLDDFVDFSNKLTTENNAVFGITFTPDQENLGKYRITMANSNNTCKVIKSNKQSNVTLTKIENSKIEDYYLNVTNPEKNAKIYVSCPGVSSTDTKYEIKLYEQVGEEDEFLYTSEKYTLNYDDYLSHFKDLFDMFYNQLIKYLEAENNQAILNEFALLDATTESKYDSFKTYLKKYQAYKESEKDHNYDKTVLINTINGAEIIPGVTGSKISNPITGDPYTFTFEDYFLGLVKTYTYYNNTESRPTDYQAYFSGSISTDTLKQTLNFMFNTTNQEISNQEKTNATMVYNYIKGYLNKTETANYTLAELKNIKHQYELSSHSISFKPNLLDNAYNFLNSKIVDTNGIVTGYKIKLSYFVNETEEPSEISKLTFLQALDFEFTSDSAFKKVITNRFSEETSGLYKAITSVNKNNSSYYEIHTGDDGSLKLVKVEANNNCKYVSITNLKDSSSSIYKYISGYLLDNVAEITPDNIANITINDLAVPGLSLNSENTYSYVTFNSDFMQKADMYAKGIEHIIRINCNESNDIVADFKASLSKIYNPDKSNIMQSIEASLLNTYGLKNELNNKSTGYYEIHYDINSDKFLLFNIKYDITTEEEIITIYDLASANGKITNKNIFAAEELSKVESGKTTTMYLVISNKLDESITKSLEMYLSKIMSQKFYFDSDRDETWGNHYYIEIDGVLDSNIAINLTS